MEYVNSLEFKKTCSPIAIRRTATGEFPKAHLWKSNSLKDTEANLGKSIEKSAYFDKEIESPIKMELSESKMDMKTFLDEELKIQSASSPLPTKEKTAKKKWGIFPLYLKSSKKSKDLSGETLGTTSLNSLDGSTSSTNACSSASMPKIIEKSKFTGSDYDIYTTKSFTAYLNSSTSLSNSRVLYENLGLSATNHAFYDKSSINQAKVKPRFEVKVYEIETIGGKKLPPTDVPTKPKRMSLSLSREFEKKKFETKRLEFDDYSSQMIRPMIETNRIYSRREDSRKIVSPTGNIEISLEKVNQYHLFETLGKGAFGKVVMARDGVSDELFACKILSKNRILKKFRYSGDEGMRMVRREVAILKKVSNHPNIIKLYEVLDDATDDNLYMFFELCNAGPVMEVTVGEPTTPLTETVAKKYFKDIILGLEYCI
jgi:hypothetical protein